MAFNYKNPTAGNTVTGPSSVTSLDRTYGTNFSVYNMVVIWKLKTSATLSIR